MANSYRIKTQIGEDQTLNVQIDQEFDFLEILSMKIQSEDIYTRNCADYGVVVGRVVANGGYGVPNVKVSVFVPIQEEDCIYNHPRSSRLLICMDISMIRCRYLDRKSVV